VAFIKITWTNTVEPDRPQTTIWRVHVACWLPKATTHTLRICNSFSTAAIVARTRLHITLISTLSILLSSRDWRKPRMILGTKPKHELCISKIAVVITTRLRRIGARSLVVTEIRLCALSKKGREPKSELLLAAVVCDSSSYSLALKYFVTFAN